MGYMIQKFLKSPVSNLSLERLEAAYQPDILSRFFSDEWRFTLLTIICGMVFWGLLAGTVIGSNTLINGQY